jgi:protein TonB
MGLTLSAVVLTVLTAWGVSALLPSAEVGKPPERTVAGPIKQKVTIKPPAPIGFDTPAGRERQIEQAVANYVIPTPVADTMLDDGLEMLISTDDQRRAGVELLYSGEDDNPGGDNDGSPGGYGADEFIRPPRGKFVHREKEPEMILECQPLYPRLAERAGIEGVVWIEALLDIDGSVRDAVVAKSSGTASLDEAALIAAYKNRFSPAIQKGRPLAIWVTYKVEFILGR